MGNLREIGRVLRHREFRMLWGAQSASVIGDNIVLVALALFVIGHVGDASDLGLVLAAQSVPLIAFLLLGGVWADRLPRHRVMVATDLVRFALHALLAALIFTGAVEIWHIAAIEMFFGAAEAFFRPAANGLLPQTVPEADIQQATAITTMTNNVAEFAGPALATALVLSAGAGWAFAIDAATFLISASFLMRVRPRTRVAAAGAAAAVADAPAASAVSVADAPAASVASVIGAEPAAVAAGRPGAPRPSVWSEIREGSREVRAHTWVWATLASFCVALFCGLAPWFVLGPQIAREQYGHLAIYGLVETALGFGTIAGSLAGVGWRPRFPLRAAMLAIALGPVCAILFASGAPLALVIPATVVAGGGIALFDVWWLTALAERIPPDKLSRVTSYDWMVSLGLLPLGYALAGPLAGSAGAVTVMVGGSALALVAFVLGLAPRQTRDLQRIGGEAAAPGGDAKPALAHHRS